LSNVVTFRLSVALERKKDHAKLSKCCHNQAGKGLGEIERLEGKAQSNRPVRSHLWPPLKLAYPDRLG
jgi:hypothetical protein